MSTFQCGGVGVDALKWNISVWCFGIHGSLGDPFVVPKSISGDGLGGDAPVGNGGSRESSSTSVAAPSVAAVALLDTDLARLLFSTARADRVSGSAG